ncbi:MAG: hypothetical protein ACW99A_23875 [Candidatus Kariarchaeaceae archaeon]|jgi:hypothetical protein
MKTMKPVLYVFIVLFVCVSMYLPGTASAAPAITSPTPGSTLSGYTVTFSWTAGGTAVSAWWVYIGTTTGGWEIYNSGNLGSNTSLTVNNIPTDGSTVYVRLWYNAGGWKYMDYEYKASLIDIVPPKMTLPTPSSTLACGNVTFTWTKNTTPVTQWWVYVGTTTGGWEIYNSGNLGSNTSLTVNNIPTDGSIVYVRLWYYSGGWKYMDYRSYRSLSPEFEKCRQYLVEAADIPECKQ